MNKATIKKYVRQLEQGEVSVLFTKVGTKQRRRMHCTRNLDLIPENLRPKSNTPIESDTIPVFDLTTQAWKSFNADNVLEFESVGK